MPSNTVFALKQASINRPLFSSAVPVSVSGVEETAYITNMNFGLVFSPTTVTEFNSFCIDMKK